MDFGSGMKPDAFEEMVRAHLDRVRGYFRSRLRDWASAEDLAQDVFVTAFLKIRDFRGESTIDAWLLGIARNHLRNFLRKHREEALGGSMEMQELLDRGSEAWEDPARAEGRLQALRDCLEQMSESSIALLKHRYVQGQNVREIASKTGKGYSALTMQFHRMRELLAECIQRKVQHSEA